jgi:TRAP-type C4-dicarboxylate transport system substrate-binding protein
MTRSTRTVVLALLALAALIVTPLAAQAKTVELTYSIFFPATHGHTLLAQQWADEVAKRTGGEVKVNIFPGATLTPADQSYDGVVRGISDMAMGVFSYVKGRFPLAEVLDLPLGYQSGLQATRLTNAFQRKFQPKEFDDVKVMYLHAHGPGILHTKKPVEKLEELAGMKIRCTGTSASVVKALGAVPVAMPQTEAYEALSRGIVDGLVSPIETLKGWKFAEVVKSTTKNLGSSYSVGFFVVMNKQKWAAISPASQQAIEAINQEWIDKTGRAWDELDQAGTEFTLAKGNKVLSLSPAEDARWKEAVAPLLAEYVAAGAAKGLPAEEALKFCQGWLKANP